MTTDPPAGYLTRPEAAKRYNRSQRALERDLEVARIADDGEVLQHYKLVTKDGAIRGVDDATTELVKNLQNDGMVPTWCVAEAYLQERFGRKGEPKPERKVDDSVGPTAFAASRPSKKSEPQGIGNSGDGGGESAGALNVEFLFERIRTLESEIRYERERHDRTVAKLFEQLEVKDKQISAWDEVTQGLTRGLATGQLTPNLLARPERAPHTPGAEQADGSKESEVEAKIVDPPKEAAPPAQPNATPTSRARRKKGTGGSATKKSPAKSTPSQSRRRRPGRKKAESKPKRPPSLFEKHTPNFYRTYTKLFRR